MNPEACVTHSMPKKFNRWNNDFRTALLLFLKYMDVSYTLEWSSLQTRCCAVSILYWLHHNLIGACDRSASSVIYIWQNAHDVWHIIASTCTHKPGNFHHMLTEGPHDLSGAMHEAVGRREHLWAGQRGRVIQSCLSKLQSHQDEDQLTSSFMKLMLQGKTQATLHTQARGMFCA